MAISNHKRNPSLDLVKGEYRFAKYFKKLKLMVRDLKIFILVELKRNTYFYQHMTFTLMKLALS
ncbi:hypothetical protein [Spiroplasma endosymbiont of Dioctria linearis]|uniref:hypothetical protein n=1 Tax=Spiroplasma endosymbiont of Dioctria linearis TaxID=3066290 RepID=UPI00313DD576